MNKIFIYDEIGPDWAGMVSASVVVSQFQKFAGQDVSVHINSPGGSVIEAQGIYNAIASHQGKVTAVIDGTAASAASYISLAASRIEIAANGTYMLHPVIGAIRGSIQEIEQYLEMMRVYNESVLAAYQAKSPTNSAKIAEMFAATTWLSASQAVEIGFANAIGQQFVGPVAKVLQNRYQHAPDSIVAKSDREITENRAQLRNWATAEHTIRHRDYEQRIANALKC